MIQILPYQPHWPHEFLTLQSSLRRYLSHLALRIDHIGSTAVPGLPAKDIIDIQVTVAHLKPALESALVNAGFHRLPNIESDHLPPGQTDPSQWKKWFFKSNPTLRAVNLHARLLGQPNQRYPLLFRDYLRADPVAAQAYAQVKIALARYHANDLEAYYDIKDPVCDLILAAAESWAAQSGWTL